MRLSIMLSSEGVAFPSANLKAKAPACPGIGWSRKGLARTPRLPPPSLACDGGFDASSRL